MSLFSGINKHLISQEAYPREKVVHQDIHRGEFCFVIQRKTTQVTERVKKKKKKKKRDHKGLR